MKVSRREVVLAVMTFGVGLFGGTAIMVRAKLDEWLDLRQEQRKILEQIEEDRTVLAEHERWSREFADLSRMLTEFPADKKMDVYWLSVMDELAKKHGVTISQRQAGEEKRIGDVYELPVECLRWEAPLEALVHFLFDLQSEGAMLEIREMLITPKEPRTDNLLRGRFTLYCAYTREPAGRKK